MKIVRGSWSTVVRSLAAVIGVVVALTATLPTTASAASGLGSGQRLTTSAVFGYEVPSGGFRSIDGSNLFMCALSTAGEIYCWGNNTFSGIEQGASDGTATGDALGEIAATPPIDLGTNVRVNQFDVGHNSACAVIDNGGVKCWGQNTNGNLGYGDTTTRYNPSALGDSLASVNLGTSVTAIKVGVGVEHACVITNARTVKCWGGNTSGQVGRGDTNAWGNESGEMGTSLPIVDIGSGVTARDIHVGAYHTCVLTNSGSVKCWGKNDLGQLGIGSTTNIGDGAGEMGSSLASISLPTGTVLSLYGGAYTTCVRMSNGSYCWGLGNYGIRFDGDSDNVGDGPSEMGASLVAMSLGTYEDVLDYSSPLSNAFAHACVVISSGRVKCLGKNSDGQLGRGNTTDFGLGSTEIGVNLTTIDFGAEDHAVDVAVAERYSCALLINGEIKCWGKNDIGQLGNGSTTTVGDGPNEMGSSLTAVPIPNQIEVASIMPGGVSTCATLTNGAIKCWGYNNFGQLGQGSTTSIGGTASEFAALNQIRLDDDRARIVYAGFSHSCAITIARDVQCWGGNSSGQLGLGDTTNRGDGPGEMGSALATVDLGTNSYVVQLALGNSHTCALLDNGNVKCWGDNSQGALGRDNMANIGDGASEMGYTLPVINLGTGRRAIQIGAGDRFTCALLDNGAVKCWGYNYYGQLGQGARGNLGDDPGEMAGLAEISLGGIAVAIAVGSSHACAILESGSLKCWGRNSDGQLGVGNASDQGDAAGEMGSSLAAVNLSGITTRTAISVAAGNGHTCALLNNHTVKCWGRGSNGQLGYENTTTIGDNSGEMGPALSSVSLGTGRSALQLAVGSNHTCVVLDDATAKCWGLNNYGQLARASSAGSAASTMGDNLTAIDVTDSNSPGVTWSTGSAIIQTASYTLDFDEPISGIDDSDFTVSGTATGCVVDAGAISTTQYSVQTNCTSDGTVAITLETGGFQDYAGNSTTTDEVSTTTTLDTTAPTATITAPGSTVGTLNPVFSVAFSETVYGIASSDFSATGTATPCSITTSVTSGTAVDVTTRCRQAGTVTLTMSPNMISDNAGNRGPATLTSSSAVTITTANPTPTITSAPPNPTSNRTLSYGVVFSQSVTDFAADDISNLGTATCTDSVSGSGSSYTVTLTCSTDGTAIMRIAPNAVTGTSGTGPTTADVTSTIQIDATGPTATWTPLSTPIAARTATFTISFDESATIGAGDVTVVGTATGCSAPTPAGSGTTQTVSVTCTSDGTVALRLGASSVPDALGNLGPTSAVTSNTVEFDTAVPTVSLSTTATTLGLASFNVSAVFNESITGLDSADFSNTGTATGCSFTPSSSAGISINISVSCTGAGTVVARLADLSVADQVGNNGPTSAATTSSVTLDATIPTAEWSLTASVLSDRTPEFNITFDASVTGFSSADISVIGGASGTCSVTSVNTSDDIIFIINVSCSADVANVGLRLQAGSVVSSSTSSAGPGVAVDSELVTIDTTSPIKTSISSPTSPTSSRTLIYSLTFSENVYGIDAGDFANTGTATGCAYTPASASGSTVDISVTCASDGTVITEVGTSRTIIDIAGNLLLGTPFSSTVAVIDTTFMSTIWSSPSSTTGSLAASYIINFGETISGLTGSDFTNRGTATGCIFNPATATGTSISISVSCTSDGTLETVLRANSVSDTAGNTGPATDTASSTVSLIRVASTPTGLITLSPKRIMDTRSTGKIGSRTGTAASTTFNVYSKGGLPASGINAVVLNVTVVDPEVGNEGGYLSVYPCASGQPDVSNLNFTNGTTIPNTVIAPVDPSGNICFYSYGKTHVLADVSGYFPTGSSLNTLSPKRIMDTRSTGKIGSRTGTAASTTFNVYSKGGLPASGINAVVLNVTVVDPEVGNEGGYLSVYPCASGLPDVSNLNFTNGTTIPNTVIAPVDPSGNVCFYSYGKTHVLADVSGYFPTS